MKKTLVALTDELRTILDHIAAKEESSLGPLVEKLLRSVPAVKKAKDELGLEWSDRPGRGNFSRVQPSGEK